MTPNSRPAILLVAPILLATLVLAGCGNLERLSEIGSPPRMTATANPTQDKSWKPVTMPMPRPAAVAATPDSLWMAGSRSFFKDQRASRVGDIVTVVVNMTDSAALGNATVANRTGTENLGIPDLLGLQHTLSRMIGKGADLTNIVSATGSGAATGTGTIARNETVLLRVAGTVTQVLPNGNLAIVGRQEMRVNSELRELVLSGVIRPEDIASDNTVQHDRMAEARISYGGRGQLTDMQTARYGEQILDLVSPF
jgi:flagellar L-ring protein precursor FlgH